MDRQNRMARQHDYTYIESPERVRLFADQGWLVRLESTRDFVVKSDVDVPLRPTRGRDSSPSASARSTEARAVSSSS